MLFALQTCNVLYPVTFSSFADWPTDAFYGGSHDVLSVVYMSVEACGCTPVKVQTPVEA